MERLSEGRRRLVSRLPRTLPCIYWSKPKRSNEVIGDGLSEPIDGKILYGTIQVNGDEELFARPFSMQRALNLARTVEHITEPIVARPPFTERVLWIEAEIMISEVKAF